MPPESQQEVVDPVLSIPDSAKTGNLSSWTLKRAAKRGELEILQLSPRRIGIRQSELMRWLESRPRWGSPADRHEPSRPRLMTAQELQKLKASAGAG